MFYIKARGIQLYLRLATIGKNVVLRWTTEIKKATRFREDSQLLEAVTVLLRYNKETPTYEVVMDSWTMDNIRCLLGCLPDAICDRDTQGQVLIYTGLYEHEKGGSLHFLD